jgi:hypothetical protein
MIERRIEWEEGATVRRCAKGMNLQRLGWDIRRLRIRMKDVITR